MADERKPKWEPKGKPWLVGLIGYVGQPMPYEEYDPDFRPPEIDAEIEREDAMWVRLSEQRERRLKLEAQEKEESKKPAAGKEKA